ncbi:type II secretion system protein [Halalkalibacter urbisdiaboli]|uniref:type II secretion system protein n=1 Tax=Halalkalibacter urbisdiaboli TaxID=1960589 RepID=UPI000B444088|nr:type II secretion system protein [Halalkalibacter urbisdiaboli]
MKKLQSQQGAALILVLFLVVFLAISGTVLLQTTSYSKKTIIVNAKEQGEFYRAEGAIELALAKMEQYDGGTVPFLDDDGEQVYSPSGDPIYINQVGPYFFINQGERLDNVTIGSKEITYSLSAMPESTGYEVVLSAGYVDDSSLRRTITFTVELPEKPVASTSEGSLEDETDNGSSGGGSLVQVSAPETLDNNTNIHQNQKPAFEGHYRGAVNYASKLQDYSLNENEMDLASTNLTAATTITSSPAYFNSIVARNKQTITIPAGTVVYAKKLNWTGQTRTLNIRGTLIIDDFNIQGSNTMIVHNTGTIIADTFRYWSNAQTTIFPSNSGAGEGSDGNNEDDRLQPGSEYTSDIDWVSTQKVIDYYTSR